MAAQATGAALLASGQTSEAMVHLRAASATWQRLNMPYESARTAMLVGLGRARLGDNTSAALEIDNASAIFELLGAEPDRRRLREVTGEPEGGGGLSARELEVLISPCI